MVYLMPITILTISYFVGSLFQKIVREKDGKVAEACLLGTCLLFLLWESLTMVAIKLVASFALVCKVYGGILLLLVLSSLLVCKKERTQTWRVTKAWKKAPVLTIAVVLILQFVYLCMVYPDCERDFTVETIYTTLNSDLLYENHPGMGSTFVYGITFRGKVVTLPLWYAYLATVFSGEVTHLVYRAIPFWVLLLSYFCYYLWAKILFDKEEKGEEKTALFLGGIGLINLSGSVSGAGLFYQQLTGGFKGEVLAFAVLLPFVVYLCYQIYFCKRYLAILYLSMVLLTAVCVTDVVKGLVSMLIAILISVIIMIGFQAGRWIRCRK